MRSRVKSLFRRSKSYNPNTSKDAYHEQNHVKGNGQVDQSSPYTYHWQQGHHNVSNANGFDGNNHTIPPVPAINHEARVVTSEPTPARHDGTPSTSWQAEHQSNGSIHEVPISPQQGSVKKRNSVSSLNSIRNSFSSNRSRRRSTSRPLSYDAHETPMPVNNHPSFQPKTDIKVSEKNVSPVDQPLSEPYQNGELHTPHAISSDDAIRHNVAQLEAAGVVDLRNTEDVDKSVKFAPAVTHEQIHKQNNEIIQELIYREIHNHDIFYRILPVYDTEVLPARHFMYNNDDKLIEIEDHQRPGYDGTPWNWKGGPEVTLPSRSANGVKKQVEQYTCNRWTEPRIIKEIEYMTAEGYPRKETTILHPPVLADLSEYQGPVHRMDFSDKFAKTSHKRSKSKRSSGLASENGKTASNTGSPFATKNSTTSPSATSASRATPQASNLSNDNDAVEPFATQDLAASLPPATTTDGTGLQATILPSSSKSSRQPLNASTGKPLPPIQNYSSHTNTINTDQHRATDTSGNPVLATTPLQHGNSGQGIHSPPVHAY